MPIPRRLPPNDVIEQHTRRRHLHELIDDVNRYILARPCHSCRSLRWRKGYRPSMMRERDRRRPVVIVPDPPKTPKQLPAAEMTTRLAT